MKKLILPVIFAVAAYFFARFINPEIEIPGILIMAAVGIFIGYMLNSVVFKEKSNKSKNDNEN